MSFEVAITSNCVCVYSELQTGSPDDRGTVNCRLVVRD